jgi:hypothetical protein
MVSPGKFSTKPLGVNSTFSGIPSPGIGCYNNSAGNPKNCPLRLFGTATLRLKDDSLLATGMAWMQDENRIAPWSYSLIAFASTDGINWEWSSIIAANVTYNGSIAEEGPSEDSLTLMKNGSVLCIFRVDGGDGHGTDGTGHQHFPYQIAISNDNGKNWGPAKTLPKGVGSARPRILAMDNGALLIGGGRPSGRSDDPMLWLNPTGDMERGFIPYSISYYHNLLMVNSSAASNSTPYDTRLWPFDHGINSSQFPHESTSYCSLLKTDGNSAFFMYSQWLHHRGNEWRAYILRFDVEVF